MPRYQPQRSPALVLLLTLSLPFFLFGQEDHTKQIDAIFQRWNNSSGPGAAVSVIQHGRLLFEKGYGLADLEYDVAIQPETIFHVASVSKQFTAMALILLEEDGKLHLDDDVHKYLPELPDYGHPLTIRNLLQHTSGIRDQWQTLALAGWSLEDVITQDQILRMLFRQKELNFTPGTEHLYSNGGYTLAAEIVTRVSGRQFPQFCADRIFKPLGMRHTHFHQDLHQIVKNRAYSYSGGDGAYQNSPLNFANVGATSLFTTSTDLTKWLDNFRKPVVGGRPAITRITEQAVLSNGKKIDYALGVSIGKDRGLTTISHSGGDAGFRSYVCWYPEQEFGIAVLSNLGSFGPMEVAGKVAAIYLQSAMTPPSTAPHSAPKSFITVGPAILKTYTGNYPLPQMGQTLVATIDHGKLFAAGPIQPPLELKALTPASFYLEAFSATIDFTPSPNGGMRVKITQSGSVNEGVRSSEQPQSEAELAEHAGAYWSEELETQYDFSIRNGKLIAIQAHHGVINLIPVKKDSFSSDQWFMSSVDFERDGQGRVKAVKLGGGRVHGIRFVKK